MDNDEYQEAQKREGEDDLTQRTSGAKAKGGGGRAKVLLSRIRDAITEMNSALNPAAVNNLLNRFIPRPVGCRRQEVAVSPDAARREPRPASPSRVRPFIITRCRVSS
jgi:hypothetical protein